MTYPACFESQRQYDDWCAAAKSVYHYEKGRMTPICTDCTPDYARSMQEAGRCQHEHEVKFYRVGKAFMGKLFEDKYPRGGCRDEKEANWEPIDDSKENQPHESYASIPRTHERKRLSRGNYRISFA